MDDLKAVADYWRKVKSGELPAPGPNEIDNTVWTVEAALKRIAELEAKLATPVQLPDMRESASGDRYRWSDGAYNYQQDVKGMLALQGFTVEGDE